MAHQLPALAQQVAHRSILRGVNIPLRQNPQAQHVRQPTRIVVVIGVLQAAVFLHPRRVGQMYLEARRHQSVDQPVPVEGGLHGDPRECFSIR